ncbi:unnamed protein product, partial [Prorocentrum cordatum]
GEEGHRINSQTRAAYSFLRGAFQQLRAWAIAPADVARRLAKVESTDVETSEEGKEEDEGGRRALRAEGGQLYISMGPASASRRNRRGAPRSPRRPPRRPAGPPGAAPSARPGPGRSPR